MPIKTETISRQPDLTKILLKDQSCFLTAPSRSGRSRLIAETVKKLRNNHHMPTFALNLRTGSNNEHPLLAAAQYIAAQVCEIEIKHPKSDDLITQLALNRKKFIEFCTQHNIPARIPQADNYGGSRKEIEMLQNNFALPEEDVRNKLKTDPTFFATIQESTEQKFNCPDYACNSPQLSKTLEATHYLEHSTLLQTAAELSQKIQCLIFDLEKELKNTGFLEILDHFRQSQKINKIALLISSLHALFDNQEHEKKVAQKLLNNIKQNTFPKILISCDSAYLGKYHPEFASAFDKLHFLKPLSKNEISKLIPVSREWADDIFDQLYSATYGRIVEILTVLEFLESKIPTQSEIQTAIQSAIAQLTPSPTMRLSKLGREKGFHYDGFFNFLTSREFITSNSQKKLFLEIIDSGQKGIEIEEKSIAEIKIFINLGLIEKTKNKKFRIAGEILRAFMNTQKERFQTNF